MRALPSVFAVSCFHPGVGEANLGVDIGAVDSPRILDLLDQVMDSQAAADGAGHVRLPLHQLVEQIQIMLYLPRALRLSVWPFDPFRLGSFFIEVFHTAEFFTGRNRPRLGWRVFVFGPFCLDADHIACDEVLVGRHFVTGFCHPRILVGELDLRTLEETTVERPVVTFNFVRIGIEAVEHHFLLCTLSQLFRCLHFFTHDTSPFAVYPDTPFGLAFSRDGGETLVMISRMIWNAVSGSRGSASLIGGNFCRSRSAVIARLISNSAMARVSASTDSQSCALMKSTSSRAERSSSSCAISRLMTSACTSASASSSCSTCQRRQARRRRASSASFLSFSDLRLTSHLRSWSARSMRPRPFDGLSFVRAARARRGRAEGRVGGQSLCPRPLGGARATGGCGILTMSNSRLVSGVQNEVGLSETALHGRAGQMTC